MALAAILDLEIDSGADFVRDVFWTDDSGAPVELFNYVCWLSVYQGAQEVVTLSDPFVYPFTNKTGIVSVNTPWRMITIPTGSYTYSISVKSPTDVITKLLTGQLKVR